ncbi:MAG: PQQ-binding-like beta-propeller repeat protein, partial [Candidatus Eremiobacterota bacterium]
GVVGDDGMLYAASGSSLLALLPDSGEESWRVDLGDDASLAPVASQAGVFVAGEREVVAVDSYSQEVTWRWSAPSPPTCLALTPEETLLVGCRDGQVASLSMLSGQPFWEEEVGSSVVGLSCALGTAVVCCQEGQLVAYDMPNGEFRWQLNLNGLGGAAPTDGAQVLVATEAGKLLSLEGQGGLPEWDVAIGAPCRGGPVPAGEWLFLLGRKDLRAFAP